MSSAFTVLSMEWTVIVLAGSFLHFPVSYDSVALNATSKVKLAPPLDHSVNDKPVGAFKPIYSPNALLGSIHK